MLTRAQAHVLNWIHLGSLLERTDVTGTGEHVEYVMGGRRVDHAELEALEVQGLVEVLGTWTLHGYGYVRYGLTAFGLDVLHASEDHGGASGPPGHRPG